MLLISCPSNQANGLAYVLSDEVNIMCMFAFFSVVSLPLRFLIHCLKPFAGLPQIIMESRLSSISSMIFNSGPTKQLYWGENYSPKIFDTLSQALCWIATNNYGIQTIFHLLDDFLTVGPPNSCIGERTIALPTLLYGHLYKPLAQHKCIGPTVCLEYLGIILDSSKMEAWLPRENFTVH